MAIKTKIRLNNLAENIYAFLNEDKRYRWNNAGFINLGGGMVVDTQFDLPQTQCMLDHIKSLTDKPVRYLVNTHDNGDHTWGNQMFENAEIIAHHLCVPKMEEVIESKRVEVFQSFQNMNPKSLPPQIRWFFNDMRVFDFTGIQLKIPNKLIEDRLDLDLDGFPCEIIYVGPAHTSNDIIVHLPKQRIVFAGDILSYRFTPTGWDGTHENWIKAIDLILSFKPEIIVPGHGPLCGVKEALEFRKYFELVIQESKRFFDQGLTAFEAAEKIDIGKFKEWTQPERLIWNILRAYRDLEGKPWNAEFGDIMQIVAMAYQLKKSWKNR